MNEQNREQISVLIDDEQTELSGATMDLISSNEEYRNVWTRFHLIGDTLRGHLPKHIDTLLANRIRKTIENEPVVLAPTRGQFPFLKPVAGVAIAASVALVAIITIQQPAQEPAVTPAPTFSISQHQPEFINPDLAKTVVAKPSVDDTQKQAVTRQIKVDTRMNRYLINHNEYLSNTGMRGILPYVRIVAFEPEELEQPAE